MHCRVWVPGPVCLFCVYVYAFRNMSHLCPLHKHLFWLRLNTHFLCQVNFSFSRQPPTARAPLSPYFPHFCFCNSQYWSKNLLSSILYAEQHALHSPFQFFEICFFLVEKQKIVEKIVEKKCIRRNIFEIRTDTEFDQWIKEWGIFENHI